MKSETHGQIAHLLKALERDFYHPLGEIDFCGFVTKDLLSIDKAQSLDKKPMPKGYNWGKPEEYCWLFSSFTLPDSAKEERIVLELNTGWESTVYLNGKPFGTVRGGDIRYPHHYLVDQTIVHSAKGDERFEIALETYSGTLLPLSPSGKRASGYVFPDVGVPMDCPYPAIIGENTYGIWNEEAYQLWLDIGMLYDIHETQPESSFFKEKINYKLCELLDKFDIEKPLHERRKTYIEMREFLSELMSAKNGTYAPSMSVIANSHIDVAWLWPLEETVRKVARTFAQQLRLLDEYPEAQFLQSQAILYEICRIYYPKLFDKIVEAIKKGSWIVEGAMWVEPDTNLAGGEALIRQIMYGKEYFKKYFDKDCKVAWLPDSFGYSGALPQILNKCGIEGLTTQKIFWTYNDAAAFPYHSFMWKGIDGTEVDCYLHMQYESFVDAKTLNTRWKDRLNKDGTGEFYLPFGYGDGGGGPTRDDYEQIRREKDIQGVPKLSYECPEHFFTRRKDINKPTYFGELYFQCHRGTYTAQAEIKRSNRLCENGVRALEILSTIANKSKNTPYPQEEILNIWKIILLNQFHDILPGSSIYEVNRRALEMYDDALKKIDNGINHAIKHLCDRGDGATLINTLSVAVNRVVELDSRFSYGAATLDGKAIPHTVSGDKTLALVNIPPMGITSIIPKKQDNTYTPVSIKETPEGYEISNECVVASISKEGLLLSFKDKKTGVNYVGSASNKFCFYRDVPRAYEAWDIDSQVPQRIIEPKIKTKATVILKEGIRASIKFEHEVLSSSIEQVISLDSGKKRLDFNTAVHWNEKHKLLKVAFDTGITSDEAANQIQFGYIMRPTHASRQFDADRFEVCNHSYTALFDSTHGAAVLNDCKYGVSNSGSSIKLTLLKGATNPDPYADKGIHRFKYAYYIWEGAFSNSNIVHEAGEINNPVYIREGIAKEQSFFSVDNPAIVIETVKLAEDNSGDIILRLYESMQGTRQTKLSTCYKIKQAWLCSMLEEKEKELHVENSSIHLNFKAFEIITMRLKCE
ncbi:MAG: alpha-mannosidase [Christensenellaceae bacterium]|nr:alpha-mannosidase [Christensenellaceae bacterium]